MPFKRFGAWKVCANPQCPRQGVKFQCWSNCRPQTCCSRQCGSRVWADSEAGKAYLGGQSRNLLAARKKKRWQQIFELSRGLSPAQAYEKGHKLGYIAGFEMARRTHRQPAKAPLKETA